MNTFVKIYRRLIRLFFNFFSIRPSSSPYLSIDSFRKLADVVIENQREFNKFQLENNQILFCKSEFLKKLFNDPRFLLRKEIILISGNSDLNIDNKDFQVPDNLKHWFCQNCLFNDSRLTTLPIGLENAWWHKNGVISDFNRARAMNFKKNNFIAYGFNVNTNPAERLLALRELQKNQHAKKIDCPPYLYKKELRKYKFVASPPGNGVDCHRTWEALYLETIPIIIKNNFSNNLNIPGILIIDDWKYLHTLSKEDLKILYKTKLLEIKNSDLLNFNSWKKMINRLRIQ